MTETKELAIHEPTGLPVVPEEVIMDYLKNLGVNIPDHHLQQFIHLAKAHNLNPFDREIYAIPRGGKLTIVIGYEVYLKRAERSRMLTGWRAWTEGDGANLVAKIEIHRKDWTHPFMHEVYFSEYKQNSPLWQSKPRTMIRKVVTAQGFRMAFPTELGGMPYTDVEMDPQGEPITQIETPPAIAEMIGTGAEPDPETPPPNDKPEYTGQAGGMGSDLLPQNRPGYVEPDEEVIDVEPEEVDEKYLKREKGKVNRLKSSLAVSEWWSKYKDQIKAETNELTSKAVHAYVQESFENWQDFETKQHEESDS